MTYRITKYILLIVLALLTLYQIMPIGDYSSGLEKIFLLIILGGLLILSFIVFVIVDIVRFIKMKRKFDFVPLIIITLFLTVFLIFNNSKTDKFWTKTILTGQIVEGDLRAAQIQLYRNNTFAIRISYVDWCFTYQGDYTIKKDTLFLNRDDINKLTNNEFDTKYTFSYRDSLLIPINKKCKMIKIKTGHNTLASNSLRFFISASSTVALGFVSGDKKSLRKP